MTTIEHALVGTDLILASGLHRRFGWQLAALGGVCAVLPDWDGLTILYSVPLFDTAHRAWGHGLFTAAVLAVVTAIFDYRFDCMQRLTLFAGRLLRMKMPDSVQYRHNEFSLIRFIVWCIAAIAAAYSHLLADIVVSGTATLSDWDVKIFYPFSDKGIVMPLVPWGDAGNTVILLFGMFAMLYWKKQIQAVAVITLFGVCCYTLTYSYLRYVVEDFLSVL
jgi:membrane-bound metal-dependent hydrolase YbcI (DUF457 family)